MTRALSLLASITMTLQPLPALAAQKHFKGPVQAELLRVVDGDTILVAARPWPQQTVDVLVRIRGIDAPEVHSSCANLREKARFASETLESLAMGSKTIQLDDISGDKYFGRVVANVILSDGRSLGELMLDRALVRPYQGRKKQQWQC